MIPMQPTAIIAKTAETKATANSATWSFGDRVVTLSRRALKNGNIRLRVTVKPTNVRGVYAPEPYTAFVDLPAAQARTKFTLSCMRVDGNYRASVARVGGTL